jgi:TonB-linked SusC/RagA family outer membrane protein
MVFALSPNNIISQNSKIKIEEDRTLTVDEVFDLIMDQTEYSFFYEEGIFERFPDIKLKKGIIKTKELLNKSLSLGDFEITLTKNNTILIKEKGTLNNFVKLQDYEIKGTITDEKGIPLPGVNILEKGTRNVASSDFNGSFSIKVNSPESILSFSYIGFLTIEKIAKNINDSAIVMVESTSKLNEVVIIGYGQTTKKDLTGSVGKLNAADVQDLQLPSVTQALQGRVTGVELTETSGEPGASLAIRIRGLNTLGNDTEPLYVIDGVPLSLGGEAQADGFGTGSNPLATINPNDIQSIEVLKDASAAAIYGSRASNGVIIITTKTGGSDKLNIDFTTRSYVQDYFTDNRLMNGIQIAQARNEQSSLEFPNLTQQELLDQDILPYRGQSNFRPLPSNATVGTNWLDSVLNQAFGQNYQITVSGKSESTNHLFSANFDNQDGVVIGSNFKRYNLRYNLVYDVSDKLKVTTSLRYNAIKNNRAQTGTRTATRGVVNWARRLDPNIPLRDEVGDIVEENEDGDFLVNPYIEATEQVDLTANQDISLSAKFLWKMSTNLNFNLRTGLDLRDSDRLMFSPFSTTTGRNANGKYTESELDHKHVTVEAFLDYNKKFGNKKHHKIGAVLGVSSEDFENFRQRMEIVNFTFDNLGVNALQLGQDRVSTTTLKEQNNLRSAFARFNYSFRGKYLLTLTGRTDGSSKFVKSNRWSFFPSVALAWNVHDESFLKNWKDLEQFKIRTTYGQTGNQAIQPYATLSEFALGSSIFTDSQFYTSTFPANIANQELTWSTTTQTNFGFDLSMFNGRFAITADYYKKESKDLLINQLIAPSTGFGSVATNLASLENEGIELSLSLGIIENEKFSWNSNINFSKNKTLVTSLGDNEFLDGGNISANFLNFPVSRTEVGTEPGLFIGWEVNGLIQTNDLTDYENGDLTIRDINGTPAFVADNGNTIPGQWKIVDQLTIDSNGDGIPDEADGVINESDRKIIGNPNPDFTFGWSNDFKIGERLGVSLFFQGSYGNDIFNASGVYTNFGFSTYNNTEEWFNKRWTLDNQHNDPRYPSGVDEIRTTNISIEDGSYIRLKNAVIRYNLPVEKKWGVKSFQVLLSATNIFTLTKYTGADPEVSSSGGSALQFGIDYNSYPRSRIISLGLNIKI